jgi:CysZ protein
MLLLSSVLMVPVASAFISMFLETIAAAVERKHYPNLPPARSIGIVEGLVDALKFLGVLIVVNLLALVALPDLHAACADPVLGGERYPPGPGICAARRAPTLGRRGAAAFRKRHRPTIFAAGVLMAVPLTIPVVNLLVPILGAATFTHLYHRLSRAGGSPARSA